MNTFRFSLDARRPTKSFRCPQCDKKELKRYVDHETGNYLPEYVGRCNREVNCGYHYTPKQYFIDSPTEKQQRAIKSNFHQPFTNKIQQSPKAEPLSLNSFSSIPTTIVDKSLSPTHYSKNNFIQFLATKFGWHKIDKCIKQFHIGTSNHWPGSTVFWQVDKDGNARTGKVMLFDSLNGKRIKKPFNHITWVHTLLNNKNIVHNFKLNQCLFGEHQIAQYPYREVAIVESEKTAIIASLYLPEFTWMACGGLSNLSPSRLQAISHMKIILYPDLNCFDKWESKAKELEKVGLRIVVSGLLESAQFVEDADRCHGLDIADYLIRANLPKTSIEKLIEKNPLIQELIERLDLNV
jgi:hypothetical protein